MCYLFRIPPTFYKPFLTLLKLIEHLIQPFYLQCHESLTTTFVTRLSLVSFACFLAASSRYVYNVTFTSAVFTVQHDTHTLGQMTGFWSLYSYTTSPPLTVVYSISSPHPKATTSTLDFQHSDTPNSYTTKTKSREFQIIMSNWGVSGRLGPSGSGWGLSDYISRQEHAQDSCRNQPSHIRVYQEPHRRREQSRELFHPEPSRRHQPSGGRFPPESAHRREPSRDRLHSEAIRHSHHSSVGRRPQEEHYYVNASDRSDVFDQGWAPVNPNSSPEPSRGSPTSSRIFSLPSRGVLAPSRGNGLPSEGSRLHGFADFPTGNGGRPSLPAHREQEEDPTDPWAFHGEGHRLGQREEPVRSGLNRLHSRHGSRGGMQDLEHNMGNLQIRMADLQDRMVGLGIGGPRSHSDTCGNIMDGPGMDSHGDFNARPSAFIDGHSSGSGWGWGLRNFMERQESARRPSLFTNSRGFHTSGRRSSPREHGRRPSGHDDEVYAPHPTRIANAPPVDIRQIPSNLPTIAGGAEISTAQYTNPVRNQPADATCAICLDGHSAGNPLVTPRACDHMFHNDCLDHWVNSTANNSGGCPTCRRPIVPERPLFANHNGILIPLHRVEQGQPHAGVELQGRRGPDSRDRR